MKFELDRVCARVNLYDLKPGDYFVEDTFPEVYRAERFEEELNGDKVCNVLIAYNLMSNYETSFFELRNGLLCLYRYNF